MKNAIIPYGREKITLVLPGNTRLYCSTYPAPIRNPGKALESVVRKPLASALKAKKPKSVCIVVSDITRPIPYSEFLPALISEIRRRGIAKKDMLILIATGMHRPSTRAERIAMFGSRIASEMRIIDHKAEDPAGTRPLCGKSASGATVRLNRHYLDADFRIITGLVEPHFMAGFSGGRKALCPGLASLETVRNFHGAGFISNPDARNGNLDNNPLHLEAESIARLAGCEFCVNVVLDSNKRPVRFFAGDLFNSHAAAVAFVQKHACPRVRQEADIVITGSGGYPLDATFYQCVKSFVSCLPAVKKGGTIISLGQCSEGIGGPEYTAVLRKYSGQWKTFLKDIRKPGVFTKDQWEFQVHTRALARVGQKNLYFITDGIPAKELERMSVNGKHASEAQKVFDSLYRKGMSVALFPEGPYCAPLK